jgi:hypothetical protein
MFIIRLVAQDTIVVQGESPAEGMANLKKFYIDKGIVGKGSIRELDLADHGYVTIDALFIGSEAAGERIMDPSELKIFVPYLTTNAVLVNYGCFVGNNGYYLSSESAVLGGRTAYGPKGDYNWSHTTDKNGVNHYDPLKPYTDSQFAHKP